MALGSLHSSAMNFTENQQGNAVLERLRSQKDEGRFCDVVLHVQGRQFRAHRNVLAACSPYFDSILRMHRMVKEQLTVTCQNHEVFQCLLNYMYTGSVVIDKNNVAELLRLANHFLVVKLKNYCAEYLDRYLDASNCLSVKEMADKYDMPALAKHATLFVQCNHQEILQREELMEYPLQKIEAFFGDKSWNIPPDSILRFVIRWVHREVASRERDLRSLLSFVSWNALDGNFILECIDQDPLFGASERCLFTILQILSQNNIHFPKYQQHYHNLKAKFFQDAEPTDGDNFLGIALSTAIAGLQEDPSQNLRNVDQAPTMMPPLPRDQQYFPPGLPNGPIPDVTGEVQGHTGIKDSSGLAIISTATSASSVKVDNKVGDHGMEGIINQEVSKSDGKLSAGILEDKVPIVLRMKVKKNKMNQGLKCHLCSFVAKDTSQLEQHVSNSHSKDITYKCGVCGFTCKWNREYYIHMKGHFKGPPFQCDRCEFTCERIRMLLMHRMKHTDERPFRCDYCGYRCRTKMNLVAHIRCHSGQRQFPCHLCGRTFSSRSTLDQHLATHNSDRPYLCDICGFTTKFLNHFVAHRRVHSGNGDVYRCDDPQCHYSTPKKSQLESHMRVHRGVRPHGCGICGRRFLEKSHLVRHERIHFNERPYKCEQCEYASTRRDKLKEHRQRHHHGMGSGGEVGTGRSGGGRGGKKGYRPRASRVGGGEKMFDPSKCVTAVVVSGAPGSGGGLVTTLGELATVPPMAHLQPPSDVPPPPVPLHTQAGFQPGLDLHQIVAAAAAASMSSTPLQRSSFITTTTAAGKPGNVTDLHTVSASAHLHPHMTPAPIMSRAAAAAAVAAAASSALPVKLEDLSNVGMVATSRGLIAKLEEMGVGIPVSCSQQLPPLPPPHSHHSVSRAVHPPHHPPPPPPPPMLMDPHLHPNPPPYNGGLDPHRSLPIAMAPPAVAIQTQAGQHPTEYAGLPACMTLF